MVDARDIRRRERERDREINVVERVEPIYGRTSDGSCCCWTRRKSDLDKATVAVDIDQEAIFAGSKFCFITLLVCFETVINSAKDYDYERDGIISVRQEFARSSSVWNRG